MYTIVQQQQQSVQLLHSLVGGEAEPKYNTDQNLFNATHCSALMTHHSFQCSMFNALMILLNALMIYITSKVSVTVFLNNEILKGALY